MCVFTGKIVLPETDYMSELRPEDFHNIFDGDAAIYGIKPCPMNVSTTTETIENFTLRLRISEAKAVNMQKSGPIVIHWS